MNHTPHFTVIGAGHGGKAMAAHLALMEFPTTLYNRTHEHIVGVERRGGVELESYEGGPRGFGRLEKVTSDMAEALKDADMVMVVVPSSAHADIARSTAPYLKDGQIVVLHPGRTCGAIEFLKVLRDNNCTADVVVAETETFIYASRSDGPAQSRIFRIKEAVPVAALPSNRTAEVLEMIHLPYPQFIDGGNVLQTGLNNMGAIFHPALTLLNSGWIEATHGDYQFYIDGVTPSVARVLEAVSKRLKVPLLLDHNALARHGVDVEKSLANAPQARTTYSNLLRKVLSQAKLKYEVRVDEADSPFLWITTMQPL